MNSQQARSIVKETFPQAFDKCRFRPFSIKQRAAIADVSALERGIDELVYGLYSLTTDEIKFVEESAT
jgi:hypothetical protein